MESGAQRRKAHTKVKSGCRTCKYVSCLAFDVSSKPQIHKSTSKLTWDRIRKVKCDEARPSCNRCIATGRECEGYGIWDEGGNRFGERQSVARRFMSQPAPILPTISILQTSMEEKVSLEWFQLRTATKLPASFVSNFWNMLLVQASVEEPAVLHAVLALSSVHKSGVLNIKGQIENNSTGNEEQVTLKHYLKAINHLQPHFLSKDRKSCRIALITCAVFVCLEFLRGHFETAQIHLRNGLKVLGEIQTPPLEGGKGFLHKGFCRESTDDWILETFSRLSLQVELFRPGYLGSRLPFGRAVQETPILVFGSLNDAWRELEGLLSKILHLTDKARQQDGSFQNQTEMLARQKAIQSALMQWNIPYENFLADHIEHRSSEEERAYQMIRTYNTMAAIMCSTALHPFPTMIFDQHADKFLILISQLDKLWKSSIPITIPDELMQNRARRIRNLDMSSSIIDLGWLPPLFYTATKCRIRKVRRRAVHLMECLAHREGIWDSKIVARVARKVVEIEECNFYNGVDEAVHFVSGLLDMDIGGLKGVDLPVLPEENRLSDVEVVLKGAPVDQILLFAKRKREGGESKVLLSEYDMLLGRWRDRDIPTLS